MNSEIVERVKAAVIAELRKSAYVDENHPDGPLIDGVFSADRIAIAAIEAYEAALQEAGMVIVPKEPTMPAMEEIFGRGPIDGIPYAEAERRFRKALEVLAAAPDQR